MPQKVWKVYDFRGFTDGAWMKTIDLRSDTVTRPSQGMREAMMRAEVGDDVFGDDPSVNALEEMLASMVNMEAAVFVPTGTQSNLIGLMAHCQRGDEYIVGQTAHTYKYEAGGAAVLGSIQPQPLDFEEDGTLALDRVAAAIKPKDFHFARTRLLSLENTVGGKALPMSYLKDASDFAKGHGLGLHLDGARVFNAAVFHEVSVEAITSHFDSVSVCLSKGLGAPVGSVLCGSKPFIGEARRWRKMVGGGMRQAGILAAAGIYALTHNVSRLADDHRHASELALTLSDLPGVTVRGPHTNMVFVEHSKDLKALETFMMGRGIQLSVSPKMRLVTHLDVTDEDVPRITEAFRAFFG